jgi:dihydrofolate reductase
MRLSLIAAMDRNRLIGNGSALPWHLPADLAYFKETTLGKPVIMGGATWASLPKALPGRTNIVLSKTLPADTAGCVVAQSLEDALQEASSVEEAFIIGGASVYRQVLPLVQRMYLTLIDAEFSGDTYFPEYDAADWNEISRTDRAPDTANPHPMHFVVYERK